MSYGHACKLEKQLEAEVAELLKKARGKSPLPPEPGPTQKDQVNLNDKESRIMPTSGGGFEQAYNVLAGVDMDTMKHRLKTRSGKAVYAKRKSTIEPVFGIIKSVMDFRQFLLHGVAAVKSEWDLVCIAFNLKRLFSSAK